jgi:hypothetical protein
MNLMGGPCGGFCQDLSCTKSCEAIPGIQKQLADLLYFRSYTVVVQRIVSTTPVTNLIKGLPSDLIKGKKWFRELSLSNNGIVKTIRGQLSEVLSPVVFWLRQ